MATLLRLIVAQESDAALASAVYQALRRLPGDIDGDLLMRGLEGRTYTFVSAAIAPGLARLETALQSQRVLRSLDQAFETGTRNANRQGTDFRTGAAARPWTSRRAARMAAQVTRETEGAIRDVVERAFNQATSASEAERLVRLTIGLTEAQAKAALRLYDEMLARPGRVVYAGKVRYRVPKKPTKALALKRAKDYAARMLRARAKLIARYERMLAARTARRLRWEELLAAGRLREGVVRRWLTVEDERVCPICAPMHGETAPVGEAYDSGLVGPPAHPLCRCEEVLELVRGAA